MTRDEAIQCAEAMVYGLRRDGRHINAKCSRQRRRARRAMAQADAIDALLADALAASPVGGEAGTRLALAKMTEAVERMACRLDTEPGNQTAVALWRGLVAESRAALTRLTSDLAECYRLTGADPDINEDWRLAPYAVVEVQRLRDEHDAADIALATALRERDEARAWVP